jgi:aldehyde dehydrogenase (NAD+)
MAIAGPLLPIVSVDSVDEAIKFVNERPKPLAVYVFTSTGSVGKRVIRDTSSGGAVINDVVVHNAVCDLPFGGVGASGMGAYHGRTGFETFSHRKAVFHQSTLIDSGKLRYPPYSKGQLQRLEWIFKSVPALPHLSLKDIAIAGLTVAVALLAYKLREAQTSK